MVLLSWIWPMGKLNEVIVLHELFSLHKNPDRLNWRPLKEGVDFYPLYSAENEDAFSAALLRYVPGAVVPHHEHMGYEHILILSGSQYDENGEYPEGTLIISSAKTTHTVRSEFGCIALGIWEKPVKFL